MKAKCNSGEKLYNNTKRVKSQVMIVGEYSSPWNLWWNILHLGQFKTYLKLKNRKDRKREKIRQSIWSKLTKLFFKMIQKSLNNSSGGVYLEKLIKKKPTLSKYWKSTWILFITHSTTSLKYSRPSSLCLARYKLRTFKTKPVWVQTWNLVKKEIKSIKYIMASSYY